MILVAFIVMAMVPIIVLIRSHIKSVEHRAHVHGRHFAAMYSLHMRLLPPDPMCDYAFEQKFYPQGEKDLRMFVDRYWGNNGVVTAKTQGTGGYFTCVARNKETGEFHGLYFTHHVDADGSQFWKEEFRTSGYETEDAAKGHIDLLYPPN